MDAGMKRLAEAVSAAQEDALQDFPVERQRARFLAAAHAAPSSRARRLVLLPVLAVGAAALVLLATGVDRRPQPLSFNVGGTTGRPGEWIGTPGGPTAVAFSDGTRMLLSRQARARVVEGDAVGARVVLERGRLTADVVHRDDRTRWGVDAGPFAVTVVGTRFDVEWDPARQRFELALSEGSVRLAGPSIAGQRLVVAGERVAIVVADAPEPGASAAAPADPEPRAVEVPGTRSLARRVAPPPPSPQRAAPHEAPPPWRARAEAGRHDEAWALVAGIGFDAVARDADASELALLADVARFSAHPAEAARALLAIRQRFPADRRAGEVAFLLGRLAADQRDDPAAAARWFSAYLDEHPDGVFAAEAAGRLIECHHKRGAAAAARAAAQRYLDAHPTGPYAASARRALAGP